MCGSNKSFLSVLAEAKRSGCYPNNNRILDSRRCCLYYPCACATSLSFQSCEHFGHYGAAHRTEVRNGRSGKQVSDEEETEN